MSEKGLHTKVAGNTLKLSSTIYVCIATLLPTYLFHQVAQKNIFNHKSWIEVVYLFLERDQVPNDR